MLDHEDPFDGILPVEPEGPSGRTPTTAHGFDLSHDQLALDLGKAGWDSNAKYVLAWSSWLFWDGQRWSKKDPVRAETLARDFLRKRAEDVLRWAEQRAILENRALADKIIDWAKREARGLRSKQTAAAVLDMARSNVKSIAFADDFDQSGHLLATPSGTVDLRTGTIREARRGDLITKLTAVAPEEGTPEVWLRLLDVAFDGDREVIPFLRRAMGYSLTGETRESKMFFCYGTGANGKSSVLNLLFHVLAEYARRAPATAFISSNTERHATEIAGLQGARLVVASELPKGKTWDEATLKDLTGGDTMTARFMRGDFFDFRPVAKLWIAGNTQPSFKGVDEAMRRRLVMIPFAVTVPPSERDPALPEKLIQEAPKILNWMIGGAVEWYRMGLRVPESIAKASDEYLDDEDLIGQFLADEVDTVEGEFTTTTDLHQRFGQWMNRQGMSSPWTVKSFQKAMAERGLLAKRTNSGRGFSGLRLRFAVSDDFR